MGMTAFRTDMIVVMVVGMTMRVVMVMVVAICMMMMAVVAMIMMIMMVMIDVNRTMFGGSQSNRLHAAPRKQFAP